MATTTAQYYADEIQIIDADQPSAVGEPDLDPTGAAARIYKKSKKALMHFPFPVETMQYKPILSVYLTLHLWDGFVGTILVTFLSHVYNLQGAFDSSTTYETAPAFSYDFQIFASANKSPSYNSDVTKKVEDIFWKDVLRYGICVAPVSQPDDSGVSVKPNLLNCIDIVYDDTDDFGKVSGSPTGGYTAKNDAKTFRWTYERPTKILADLSATSFRFAYRKGTTGDFTFVNCGTDLSYTVPAGTFSDADIVQWYPEVTLNNGQTLTPVNASGTPIVYQLTTVEPAFTAVAVSPSDSFEDGSEPITFSWTASNTIGSQPSGADLQYSTDGGSTWSTLGSVTGSALTYIAPANTLPSGQIYWRVRAINNTGTAGSWSSPLTFINVAAPPAPSVNSDAAPFSTITWSAVGQQAFELIVDGVSYGVHFGSDKTYTLPQPLADGNHTAQVRIQGQYGLWSQFGSVTFNVANTPDGFIDLTAVLNVDAFLSWSTSSAETGFLIYRDGVQIGRTSNYTFSDRRSLGTHVWYVLLRQADGNYTKSNEITGTLAAESPLIAPLAGGPWIALRLTESSTTTQTFSYEKTHTLRHYSGSPFPVIELTPYEDFSGAISCAFADADEARAFEALRGQVVILKIRGTVLIGGLMNLDKAQNPLYVAYQFTINQIAVEEIVDD